MNTQHHEPNEDNFNLESGGLSGEPIEINLQGLNPGILKTLELISIQQYSRNIYQVLDLLGSVLFRQDVLNSSVSQEILSSNLYNYKKRQEDLNSGFLELAICGNNIKHASTIKTLEEPEQDSGLLNTQIRDYVQRLEKFIDDVENFVEEVFSESKAIVLRKAPSARSLAQQETFASPLEAMSSIAEAAELPLRSAKALLLSVREELKFWTFTESDIKTLDLNRFILPHTQGIGSGSLQLSTQGVSVHSRPGDLDYILSGTGLVFERVGEALLDRMRAGIRIDEKFESDLLADDFFNSTRVGRSIESAMEIYENKSESSVEVTNSGVVKISYTFLENFEIEQLDKGLEIQGYLTAILELAKRNSIGFTIDRPDAKTITFELQFGNLDSEDPDSFGKCVQFLKLTNRKAVLSEDQQSESVGGHGNFRLVSGPSIAGQDFSVLIDDSRMKNPLAQMFERMKEVSRQARENPNIKNGRPITLSRVVGDREYQIVLPYGQFLSVESRGLIPKLLQLSDRYMAELPLMDICIFKLPKSLIQMPNPASDEFGLFRDSQYRDSEGDDAPVKLLLPESNLRSVESGCLKLQYDEVVFIRHPEPNNWMVNYLNSHPSFGSEALTVDVQWLQNEIIQVTDSHHRGEPIAFELDYKLCEQAKIMDLIESIGQKCKIARITDLSDRDLNKLLKDPIEERFNFTQVLELIDQALTQMQGQIETRELSLELGATMEINDSKSHIREAPLVLAFNLLNDRGQTVVKGKLDLPQQSIAFYEQNPQVVLDFCESLNQFAQTFDYDNYKQPVLRNFGRALEAAGIEVESDLILAKMRSLMYDHRKMFGSWLYMAVIPAMGVAVSKTDNGFLVRTQ